MKMIIPTRTKVRNLKLLADRVSTSLLSESLHSFYSFILVCFDYTTSWVHFGPASESAMESLPSEHGLLYSEFIDFNTPPLATPAILSFLSLINTGRSIPLPPSNSHISQDFQEWNCEWEKMLYCRLPQAERQSVFQTGQVKPFYSFLTRLFLKLIFL